MDSTGWRTYQLAVINICGCKRPGSIRRKRPLLNIVFVCLGRTKENQGKLSVVKTQVGSKAFRVNSSPAALTGSNSPWHGVVRCNIMPLLLDPLCSTEKPGKQPVLLLWWTPLMMMWEAGEEKTKNWSWGVKKQEWERESLHHNVDTRKTVFFHLFAFLAARV